MKLLLYMVISISALANLTYSTPIKLSSIGNTIVQPDEYKPGKDYSHFVYRREARPEPYGGGGHGGGGHGGGFGGGRGGGFGGGHGGYGGGFGGRGSYGGGYGGFGHGVAHYGGGFGGGPIIGIGSGGFIPVYRPRPYGYGYGYGRYRRNVQEPQLPRVSAEATEVISNVQNNTTNNSKTIDQHEEEKRTEIYANSKAFGTSNTPIFLSQQIERERTQRSALPDAEVVESYANAGDGDRYSNLDHGRFFDFTVVVKS